MDTQFWTATTYSPEKIMAVGTLAGGTLGWRFYEHPVFGDEAPLLAVKPGEPVFNTHEYEVPEVELA